MFHYFNFALYNVALLLTALLMSHYLNVALFYVALLMLNYFTVALFDAALFTVA